ncbi:MAG: cadherin-like beta sandwich domain-containing protein, partial [Sphingobacteriales bacterium]
LSLGTNHPINAGSGVDVSGSYDITFISNNLTISTRPITITANSGQSKVYGQSDPTLQYSVTTSNTVNGDVLNGALSRATGDVVGIYSVNQGTLTNANNANYNITFNTADFNITQAALTVTADNKVKDFSAPIPTLTYQVSGFTNGDNQASFTSPVVLSTSATAASAPGDYSIVPSNAANANYTITYVNGTLTINAPSPDNTLSNLITNIGTLNPVFNPNTEDYEVSVMRGTTQVDVTPTANNAYAVIEVNYIPVTSGSSSTQSIQPGDNPVPIVVTAQNGTTKQYNLNIKAPLETNAKLQNLVFFDGGTTLNPAFDKDVHTYTMDVPNATRSVRIVPYAESSYATVTINGTLYNGYSAPGLQAGANVFDIVVTSQDRNSTETYTLTINRALSSNNNLFALSLDGVTLTPSFNAGTTSYTANVPNSKSSVGVTASVADTTARVKVGDDAYTNYINKTVNLSTGSNAIAIDVKAQNGDVKTYVVAVVRALSADATLSNLVASAGTNLALSPSFDPATITYSTQAVPYATSSVNITPTTNSAYATVMVNGSIVTSGNSINLGLNVGSNAISVVTTAQNGSTKEYTINITRNTGSANNLLANIALSEGKLSPYFSTITEAYTVSVDNSVTFTQITPTAVDSKATIGINGSAVASGVSKSVALAEGLNTVIISVTSETGLVKNYTLSITRRVISNDPSLSLSYKPASVMRSAKGRYFFMSFIGYNAFPKIKHWGPCIC